MKKLICCFICLCFVLFITGCNNDDDYSDQIKVTFHLEGGTYMNCTRAVVLYFNCSDDNPIHICPPNEVSNNEITRSGYDLTGWYKTKNVDGENVSYVDEFDFANETINKDGLTLYAKWEKKIVYSYNVCYKDSTGETIILGTYKVKVGDKFEDYLKYANKNYGNTPLGFFDEEGNEWNADFTHPGGEASLAVNVYVQYLEGEFKIVKSANDLGTLIKSSQNIYLANDIDLAGKNLSFDNYRGHLIGNGYTISNFNLNYDARSLLNDFEEESGVLCLSLFGRTKDAIIEDINFANVTFVLKTNLSKTKKIYVAPIAVSMNETQLKNINFTGTFEIEQLPNNFDVEENLVVVYDSAYYIRDELSTVENVNVTFTNIQNNEEE